MPIRLLNRPIKHLTPRYVINRVAEIIYHASYPDHPWLTSSANKILADYLRSADVGLEFGSGRSTVWFARHVAHLTSVEHNAVWHSKVVGLLVKNNLSNANVLLFGTGNQSITRPEDSPYVKVTERFADESLDFVLVDGIYRDVCTNAALYKLKPGGLLIFDNANLYLPCRSISPNSRSLTQGAASPEWATFLQRVKEWRCIWTTNGVSDTALFIKPCDSSALTRIITPR